MTRFALVLLAGCGFRITAGSNGVDGMTGDDATSTVDGDVTTDGSTDGMPIDGPLQSTCILAWLNHTISFDSGTPIATVNSTSYDRDPFVSPNELSLWFSNGGAQSQGGGDIFLSTRASTSFPFGPPTRDARFSTSGGVESKMSMTADGLFVVVGSNQGGGSGGTDIWECGRPTLQAMWGQLNRDHVDMLGTTASELDSFVTPDGLHLYYAPTSPMPQHLVVAKRTTVDDDFSSVVDVGGVNTASGESDPMLFSNDRIIVFSSDRPSTNNSAGNIWYATRTGNDGPFGAPTELPGVSSDLDDADAHVSADGCRIYFSRNVGNGVDWELFSATAQ